MPPATSYRRSTNTIPPLDNDPFTSAPRRTATGRAVRPNATRPTNYYARPYGPSASAGGHANGSAYAQEMEPGFFPAIQFFSDAITALPKETMRQFTLMKEVEAKIHGPNQKMGEMIDALLEMPVPSRSASHGSLGSLADVRAPALPSLTANNSTIGSANVSVVNGMVPSAVEIGSTRYSIAESMDGESDHRLDVARRRQYHDLCVTAQGLLSNLDEKNAVLAEANRVMSLQLLRIDSVLPHIDHEISEDARLGSMIHWAYSDNRQKKQTSGTGAHSRAVQATNALASVASAFHEAEITQARREAGREATREKQKNRAREHVDSDFDDRPRKTQKVAKSKPATPHVTGLGIVTNGETGKRKKVEKLAAPSMERSASNNKASKAGGRESPRSTPAVELHRKPKGKPGPLPKKKLPTSASNSPALVSSPLHHSFNPSNIVEPPTSAARPQSSRLRQNSSTNLRHERFAEESVSRPSSVGGKQNGQAKVVPKKRTDDQVDEKAGLVEHVQKSTETESGARFPDRNQTDPDSTVKSRSRSQSHRGAPNSQTGTPRVESGTDVPSMTRTRSTRGMRAPGGNESSSSEPQQQGPVSSHKRALSNSHLVRQLAPYNRSPDLDRNRNPNDEDDDIDSVDARERLPQEPRHDHDPMPVEKYLERKPLSRHSTAMEPPSSPGVSDNAADDEEDELMHDPLPQHPAPDLIPDTGADAEPDFDDEDSEHDPDDPNEPKYCYCNRGSYGEMVACDNENCAKEWFHLGCTELTDTPGEEEVWYCRDCRPKFEKKRAGRGTTRGRAM